MAGAAASLSLSLSLAGESARCVAERWTLAALRSFLAFLLLGTGEEVAAGARSGRHRWGASSSVGVVARVEVLEAESDESEGAELVIDAVRCDLGVAVKSWVESWVSARAGVGEVGSRRWSWLLTCGWWWALVGKHGLMSGNFSCSVALPGRWGCSPFAVGPSVSGLRGATDP